MNSTFFIFSRPSLLRSTMKIGSLLFSPNLEWSWVLLLTWTLSLEVFFDFSNVLAGWRPCPPFLRDWWRCTSSHLGLLVLPTTSSVSCSLLLFLGWPWSLVFRCIHVSSRFLLIELLFLTFVVLIMTGSWLRCLCCGRSVLHFLVYITMVKKIHWEN